MWNKLQITYSVFTTQFFLSAILSETQTQRCSSNSAQNASFLVLRSDRCAINWSPQGRQLEESPLIPFLILICLADMEVDCLETHRHFTVLRMEVVHSGWCSCIPDDFASAVSGQHRLSLDALFWGGAISFYFKSLWALLSDTSTLLSFLTDVSSDGNSIINVTELGWVSELDVAEIISPSRSPSSSLTPDPRRLVNIGNDSVCQGSLASTQWDTGESYQEKPDLGNAGYKAKP